MQTPAFAAGLAALLELARTRGPVCLMCAETCHWRCHRMLLSDALAVRNCRVLHLMQRGKPPLPHKLTNFARVEGTAITYPPPQQEEAGRPREAAGTAAGAGEAAKAGGQKRMSSFLKQQTQEDTKRQQQEQARAEEQRRQREQRAQKRAWMIPPARLSGWGAPTAPGARA